MNVCRKKDLAVAGQFKSPRPRNTTKVVGIVEHDSGASPTRNGRPVTAESSKYKALPHCPPHLHPVRVDRTRNKP